MFYVVHDTDAKMGGFNLRTEQTTPEDAALVFARGLLVELFERKEKEWDVCVHWSALGDRELIIAHPYKEQVHLTSSAKLVRVRLVEKQLGVGDLTAPGIELVENVA